MIGFSEIFVILLLIVVLILSAIIVRLMRGRKIEEDRINKVEKAKADKVK